MPPTVCAISRLLRKYQIKVRGKNIVVVGAGRLVGYPLAIWFLQEKATVSVLNRYTKDAQSFTKNADILISGVGKPNLIRPSMIKSGAVVMDAGTSIRNDKLVGDVDFEPVSKNELHYACTRRGGTNDRRMFVGEFNNP